MVQRPIASSKFLAVPLSGVSALNRLDALARSLGLVYVLALAIMTAPILIWPIPRSADLVDHWARLTLYGMPHGDPLAALYRLRFALIPNLGIDALYLALSPLFSPESVARLAWALSLWLPAWGAWRLHRALFPAPSWPVTLAPLISFNLVVTAGLVNYGFGIGLALLALAWRVERDDRPLATTLIVLNLVAVVLFFCHLAALLAFALALGLIALAPRPREVWRAAAARAAVAPLSVATGLVLAAFAETTPTGFALTGHKFQAFTAPFFAMHGSDAALAVAILALLGPALRAGALTIAPRMRLPLLGFGLAVVFAPSARGAANLIDARLAVFFAYLAIASLGGAPRFARLAPPVLLALCLARVAALSPAWSDYNNQARGLREAFAAIPLGARVLAVGPAGGCRDSELPMLNGLSAFATIDRRALVNTLFSGPGMQPIAPVDADLGLGPKMVMSQNWLTPEGRAKLGDLASATWAGPYAHWREHFDTIVVMHGRCAGALDLPDVRPIATSPLADVYRAP